MQTSLHAHIAERLTQLWSRDTSSDGEGWTVANPAWGQCAVTACLVQDLLGGDIVWAEARLPDGRAISHYFNVVEGRVVDLTTDRRAHDAALRVRRSVVENELTARNWPGHASSVTRGSSKLEVEQLILSG